MGHIFYQWNQRVHPDGTKDVSASYDEFVYFGVDGDITPQGSVTLPVILGETQEEERTRIRQILGRNDVHWW